MKEYIKQTDGLLSIVPNLRIETTLPDPADIPDSEKLAGLCFVPSEGIYSFDIENDVWVKIIDISSPGQSSDNVIGCIKPFYGVTSAQTQDGWILCDGRTLNYNDYPELALVIDPTLQPGSTFTIPNLVNYYPTMIGTSSVAGMNSDVYTLGQAKLPTFPEHQHADSSDSHSHTITVKHTHKYMQFNQTNYLFNNFTGYDASTNTSTNATGPSVDGTIILGDSQLLNASVSNSGTDGQLNPPSVGCPFYIKAE